jgi:hypothetical protein
MQNILKRVQTPLFSRIQSAKLNVGNKGQQEEAFSHHAIARLQVRNS